MTDRLAVMRDGVLQQIGTADEIHNRPVNAFVSQFFGLHSMNLFLLSKMREEAGNHYASLESGEVGIPQSLKGMANRSGSLILGCRPHAVEVLKAGERAPENALTVSGKVYVAEPLGDEMLVTIQVGDLIVQAFDARKRDYAIDEQVTVVTRAEMLYAFDPETEATTRFSEGAGHSLKSELQAV